MWETLAAIATVGAVLVAAIYGWPAFRRELQQTGDHRDGSEFAIADWTWCVERGITADALLADLISLDYSVTPGLDGASEGHVAQWAPVFEASPETWQLVVSDDKIVAYWSFFSLSEDLQQKMIGGGLFDSEIVRDKIRLLNQPATHSVYVPMLAIHKWFISRRAPIFRMLLNSLYDQIGALEAQGIVFEGIYANGFTNDGTSLARALKFHHIADAKQGGEILGRPLDAELKAHVRKLLKR